MNIKQSFRIIFRNKTYSVLNIVGLAIGIAAAALVLLWVEYQVNFNRNISKIDRLYLLGHNAPDGDNIRTTFVQSVLLHETLNDEFPEVKRNARYYLPEETLTKENAPNQSFVVAGIFADSTLISMLDIQIVQGDLEKLFETDYSIVISESMAKTVFGNENPLGQTLEMEEQGTYTVTGVFEDLKKNNMFSERHWIAPLKIEEDDKYWGAMWIEYIAELEPMTDIEALDEKLRVLLSEKTNGGLNHEIFLFHLKKQWLYDEFKDGKATKGGTIRTVRLFSWIGIIILLIACINFMNLSTARAEKRALEVGVRKTFGAKRSNLITQFLFETSFTTLISLALAMVIVYFSLPAFNKLVFSQLVFDFTNPYHTGGLLIVFVVCALFSGIYPAFYLSAYDPMATLKKLKTPEGSTVWIRKGLVIFQFIISFVLISMSIIIYSQITHALNRPMGFNKENLITFYVSDETIRRFDVVRNELLNTGYVENSAVFNGKFLRNYGYSSGHTWKGKDPNFNPLVSSVNGTLDMFETMGFKFIEGGPPTRFFEDDEFVAQIVVNQTLADMMGEEGKVGGIFSNREIVGIVEDYVFNDIYGLTQNPIAIYAETKWTNTIFIRLKENVNKQGAIEKIQEILKPFNSDETVNISFVDQRVESLVHKEKLLRKIVVLFSALAIFISCLGLFGLSAFSASQRNKEIGIRKVLGASVWSIINLLTVSFLKLVAIAVVIALPISWYIGHTWLQNYGYKIHLSWTIFAVTTLIVFLIAILTVVFQAAKAATANPVNSIKN